MYDPEESRWKMMWISTGALVVQDLRAEMRDVKLTMWQVHPDRPGFMADFTVEEHHDWYRVPYTKGESEEWVPQFKLSAQRIACS